MSDGAAVKLSSADWLHHPDSMSLMEVLNGAGLARFVGGCVRNTLLGEPVSDIDIATNLPPERTMSVLRDAGIKVVPTGMAHGTVTAVMPSRPFEITTLRVDVMTDGRHADVAFTEDWRADAARRDFTINALYADADGTLHDPLGTGKNDLEAGRVRFIGDPDARIAEDYLRALRFFRFHGRYAKGLLDAEGLKAVREAREGLRRLSGERVRDEILKILAHDSAPAMLIAMREAQVLEIVLAEAKHIETLRALAAIDAQQFFIPDPVLRLGVLIEQQDVETVASRLRLSNRDRDRLCRLHRDRTRIVSWLSPREVRHALYLMGAELFRDRVMLEWSAGGADRQASQWLALLALADSWHPPVFPLTGEMIKAAGVSEGPKVGEIRREVERWWIESDFTTDKYSLIERLKAVVQALG